MSCSSNSLTESCLTPPQFCGTHSVVISEACIRFLRQQCNYFDGFLQWKQYEMIDGYSTLRNYRFKVSSYLREQSEIQALCRTIVTCFDNPVELYTGWSSILNNSVSEVIYQLDYFCVNPRLLWKLVIGGMTYLLEKILVSKTGTELGSDLQLDIDTYLTFLRVWIESSRESTLSKIHFLLMIFAIFHGPYHEETSLANLKDLLFKVCEPRKQSDLTLNNNPLVMVRFELLKSIFTKLFTEYQVVLHSSRDTCVFFCEELDVLYKPRILTPMERLHSNFETHSFETYGAVRMPCCFSLAHYHCFVENISDGDDVTCPICYTRINRLGYFIPNTDLALEERNAIIRIRKRSECRMPAHFSISDITNPFNFLEQGLFGGKNQFTYTVKDRKQFVHNLKLSVYRKSLYGKTKLMSKHVVNANMFGTEVKGMPNMSHMSIEGISRIGTCCPQIRLMLAKDDFVLPDYSDIEDDSSDSGIGM